MAAAISRNGSSNEGVLNQAIPSTCSATQYTFLSPWESMLSIIDASRWIVPTPFLTVPSSTRSGPKLSSL